MANGIGMEDVAFYAKVGPENLKKLGASAEAAIFTMVLKDTISGLGCSYEELKEVSGFGVWQVNEAIGSLMGKGYLTTNQKEMYTSSSFVSDIPAAVVAANETVPSVGVPSASVERYSPPDILIPGGGSSSVPPSSPPLSSDSGLTPEMARAIGIDYQETISSHAKKDAKKGKDKGNVMNLMNGLSTGRLIDNISDKNDFSSAMQNVGGNMGTMMEGLTLKMPSVPMDGREMKDVYEDEG